MNQQGSNPFTETMKTLDIDTEKGAKAFGFLEDLVYKYKVTPKGEKSPIDDFKAGTVAMLVDGNWQLAGLETSNVKWAVSTYPKIFDKQANWGASEGLVFPLNEKGDASKKQAAAEFVKWLSNNSGDWAKSGQLPANKKALEAAKAMPGRQAFIDELTTTMFLPAHPKATQIFSSAAPSPILTAAQDALLNNKNPLDIVKKMKTDMEAVLNQ
jgi:multiple sugar transport system substrate-binding protein